MCGGYFMCVRFSLPDLTQIDCLQYCQIMLSNVYVCVVLPYVFHTYNNCCTNNEELSLLEHILLSHHSPVAS